MIEFESIFFLIQGPEIALRTARLFRGSDETLNIYDCNHFELQIGPFDYKPWPGAERYILLPGKSYFYKLNITIDFHYNNNIRPFIIQIDFIRNFKLFF